ncbi:urea ABC transporter ATP-binding protein UrtD [Citricoccus muralis]|uniref:Urea ABC transporter ATP-binding protein UrtD n=1 Tax=Citricoccus muralis TaxID=169134 RepID=A0ABY8H7R2_9MICC|nr:urea ABC transporter ATP-binding protein UrtD [Citricoccus muralis]WFP17071.1 urea ABC transporter ATP-binding protein UrtD [Citricoccus muralis]
MTTENSTIHADTTDAAGLVVENLRVRFGDFVAVDSASFQARRGEVHFLIGPNGAGKTTCVDAITGLAKATGSVRHDGREVLGTPVQKIARQGFGRTFQTASVFEGLSVLQNLDIAAGLHRRWLSLLGVRKHVDERIEEALDSTGLRDLQGTLAGVLSHGQKQWLEIGMLLVQDATVLMLDEPVAGMSFDERQATGELLRRIAPGRSIVVVEHDMDFVRDFADYVTVLHQGSVLSAGSIHEVQADRRVQQVYLGATEDIDEPEYAHA